MLPATTVRRCDTAQILGEGAKVKNWMAYILAGLILGGGATFAQTASEMPAEHNHMGGHMDGPAGGGFHRRFDDAEKWAKKFDDPARDAWQKPEAILDALNLKPDSSVADIGAGTGYFSVRIAKRVSQGKVFAADVEPDMVRYLGERAQREHLSNIVPVQASAEAANLPEPVDFILVADTYHHIGNRTQYFARLKASLHPGGLLAIVDFKADSPNGPPPQHRIPPEKVTGELDAAGYSLVKSYQILPRQYFLVFRKQDS